VAFDGQFTSSDEAGLAVVRSLGTHIAKAMSYATLGSLESRHHGALLSGHAFSDFSSSEHPWMVFEVYEVGVAIRPDPRPLAKFRRLANTVLMPLLRPLQFLASLGSTAGLADPWDLAFREISSFSIPRLKCIRLQSKDGQIREFRFATQHGLQLTIRALENRGISILNENGTRANPPQAPMDHT